MAEFKGDKNKPKASKRRRFSAEMLTPIQIAIFRHDALNNFTMSARQLGLELGYSRQAVGQARAHPAYQYQVHRFQLSALETLEDAQGEAARTLQALLNSPDDSIKLGAALAILQPVREAQKKSAVLRAIADTMRGGQNTKDTQVIEYKTEWGSTAEAPGLQLKAEADEPDQAS